MADPIARAVDVFAKLKGMDYQAKEADARREDREFQRRMAENQESRAAEQFEMNKRTSEDNAAWTQMERSRQVEGWRDEDIAGARQKADQILLEFTGQMKASGKDEWGAEEVQALLTRLEPVKHGLRKKLSDLYHLPTVTARREATENIFKQLHTGTFDHDDLLKNANIAFEPELDARGQKYGAQKVRFNRLVPSPQGDGFMAELEITKADGSVYRAPATVNSGTVEDGDNEVKNFRMEEVFPYLVGQLQTLQGAEAYLKSRGLIQETKRKVKEGGSDNAGRYLYDENSGEVLGQIHGPMGGMASGGRGGSGGGVKSHLYDELHQMALRLMITDYGIDDGDFGLDAMGNQRVDEDRYLNKLPKAAQKRYLRAIQEGERLMVEEGLSPILAIQQAFGSIEGPEVFDPMVLKKAEEIARKEAANKAGWFSSDGSDFAQSGGTREGFIAERTQYWARKLSGKEGRTAGNGGGGTAFSRLPGGEQAEASATKVVKALKSIPDEAARVKEAKLFLASDAPEDVKEQVRYQYWAQEVRSKAAEASAARKAEYLEGLAKEATPHKVQGQIYTGMNRAMDQSGFDRNWQLKMVGKGLAAVWKITPAQLLGAQVAGVWEDFRQWATHRYQRPDAAQDPQVLAEYAKENPERARQIEQEAVRVAQAGNSSGMAR
ncbi:MAG: hypothetical protein R2940_16705 [Syntrophotaleaceae bacterium]